MSEHPNAALYRRVMEGFADRDMGPFVDSVADDVVWWQIESPEPARGRDAVIQSMDIESTAEIAHVEDGKVTERWAFSDGTQRITDFFSKFGWGPDLGAITEIRRESRLLAEMAPTVEIFHRLQDRLVNVTKRET